MRTVYKTENAGLRLGGRATSEQGPRARLGMRAIGSAFGGRLLGATIRADRAEAEPARRSRRGLRTASINRCTLWSAACGLGLRTAVPCNRRAVDLVLRLA